MKSASSEFERMVHELSADGYHMPATNDKFTLLSAILDAFYQAITFPCMCSAIAGGGFRAEQMNKLTSEHGITTSETIATFGSGCCHYTWATNSSTCSKEASAINVAPKAIADWNAPAEKLLWAPWRPIISPKLANSYVCRYRDRWRLHGLLQQSALSVEVNKAISQQFYNFILLRRISAGWYSKSFLLLGDQSIR